MAIYKQRKGRREAGYWIVTLVLFGEPLIYKKECKRNTNKDNSAHNCIVEERGGGRGDGRGGRGGGGGGGGGGVRGGCGFRGEGLLLRRWRDLCAGEG